MCISAYDSVLTGLAFVDCLSIPDRRLHRLVPRVVSKSQCPNRQPTKLNQRLHSPTHKYTFAVPPETRHRLQKLNSAVQKQKSTSKGPQHLLSPC